MVDLELILLLNKHTSSPPFNTTPQPLQSRKSTHPQSPTTQRQKELFPSSHLALPRSLQIIHEHGPPAESHSAVHHRPKTTTTTHLRSLPSFPFDTLWLAIPPRPYSSLNYQYPPQSSYRLPQSGPPSSRPTYPTLPRWLHFKTLSSYEARETAALFTSSEPR